MTSYFSIKELYQFKAQNNSIFTLRRCRQKDLKQIYFLELQIDPENPASEKSLKSRLDIFNDGFLIAADQEGKIVGYLHSILLNDFNFSKFEEISNFFQHFNYQGDTLYINFIGVSKEYRRIGIALYLLRYIEKIAIYYKAYKVKLVSKSSAVNFYKKFGYKIIDELPNFLKNNKNSAYLMEKIL